MEFNCIPLTQNYITIARQIINKENDYICKTSKSSRYSDFIYDKDNNTISIKYNDFFNSDDKIISYNLNDKEQCNKFILSHNYGSIKKLGEIWVDNGKMYSKYASVSILNNILKELVGEYFYIFKIKEDNLDVYEFYLDFSDDYLTLSKEEIGNKVDKIINQIVLKLSDIDFKIFNSEFKYVEIIFGDCDEDYNIEENDRKRNCDMSYCGDGCEYYYECWS